MRYLIFVSSLLLLFSCANTQQLGQGKEIKLQAANSSNRILLSDVVTPLQIVQLESSELCQLKNIAKVEALDSCYYVLGGTDNPSVHVFDGTGKFLRKIGKIGHGKGEYVNAHDFALDKQGKRIVILSAPSKVYFYDLNGNYLSSQKLGKAYCWNIASTDKGFVGSTNHLTYTSGDDACLIYYFDKNFNQVRKEIPVLPHQVYMPSFGGSVFQKVKGKDCYVDIYRNAIYQLSVSEDNTVEYSISLPNPMPTDKFESWNEFSKYQRKYDWLQNVYVVGDKAIFIYVQDAHYNVESMYLSGKPITSGCLGMNFPPTFTLNDNTVILCISAYSFIKNKLEDFLPELKGKVKASDNYILVKCRLKEKQGI